MHPSGGRRPGPRRHRALPLFAAATAASVVLLPLPARAQPHPRGQDGVGGPGVRVASTLGPIVLDGDVGLEAAAGLELRWSRFAAALRGAELALVPGEAEAGYRWETLSNGQRRCREAATGRFAADTRCIELATALGVSAETSWRVAGDRRPLQLGAGFRAGEGAGPYGTVRWRAVPGTESDWHLRASAGPAILRVAVGFTLSL